MGVGFKKGGWNFDSLVRAVRSADGGTYRLLGVAARVRMLSLLACLPREAGPQKPGVGHYNFWHSPSRACAFCRAEAVAISICDLLARMPREVIENVA